MSLSTAPAPTEPIIYPDSDGQPMAENTEQFQWIVLIKENLEALFGDDADVFVAGDLLWYPVERRPDIRRAPDAMVAFGRPKGRRGSYRQWEEGGIAPQVVFEVLSPGNTLHEMAAKFEFYDRYGVEEYYLYDPDSNDLSGWQRHEGRLMIIAQEELGDRISPRLGIRFSWSIAEFKIFYPDGQPFLTLAELKQQREAERRAREQAEQQREAER
ncbi:MAG: Uma2 family endonuclease, partial [Chloroflexaceae bacterium]|nr:Uma2 family endonuclease [Chloroflexaceae bacterium]